MSSAQFTKSRVLRRMGIVLAAAAVAVGATASTGVSAPTPDPSVATRFSLTIDGYEIATFSELSGITSEVEPTEYMSSSDKEVVYKKLPGKLKPPTITLKRGLTGGTELWAWHEAVRKGQVAVARKSVSLVAYNAEGKPVAKWWLENAWPSKLEIGSLKAGSSTVMTESVTLVAEFLQRVAP